MDHRKNAFETYNVIGEWFAQNRSKNLMEQPYLDRLIESISAKASVLDLGCGHGEPILAYLTQKGLKVVGVDASYQMIALAKQKFPDTTFYCQDMRNLVLNEQFDAIVMWHSLFHLPQEDQLTLFDQLLANLKPNGILLFTSGSEAGETWSLNGGENLYHASLSTEQYRLKLVQNGFEILLHVTDDPNCGGATVWMAKSIS